MGEVQKIYSDFNKMGNIFTRYFVTIKEIYKGDLSVSETIEISMPGGVVPLKEYSENTESYVKKDWEDIDEANYETGYIEEICDEEPLPKVKEKCILFLKKIKEYEPETIYMAIGNYQGRFVVEENRINRLLPKGEKDTFNVDTLEKLKSELK